MVKRALLSTGLALLLAAGPVAAVDAIWRELPLDESVALRGTGATESTARRYQADILALRSVLERAPHETTGILDHQIRLPMPDGGLVLFSVVESPIMAPGLAARYPGIKTFKVVAVGDSSTAGRIDITPMGFHGMIETPEGRVFIDPDNVLRDNIYIARDASSQPRKGFYCGVQGHSSDIDEWLAPRFKTANRVSGNLLRYDLAVAVTNEYYVAAGGTPGDTTAAITTTINRVNVPYERDLGIRLNLITNNDLLYEDVDTGQLNNENEFALLFQVKGWIDGRVGVGAYDIGHIFSKPASFGGGIANLGAVCNDDIKAGGVSGLPNPTGDPFDIDFVAHEIGHQFNAEHSFNGTSGACNNRNAATAFEPGSGSTIMSYAGICPGEDLQPNSDATFHAGSIAQIDAFTSGPASCYDLVEIEPSPGNGNSDPEITAIADTTIPANTPFLLDGSATDVDPDPDTLSYQWDQLDAGCPTDLNTLGTDNGSNALFRSYTPRAESSRSFPALGTQLQGRYDKAEVLPCHDRTLDFRLTVRDGKSGRDTEDLRVAVVDSAGPFRITSTPPVKVDAGISFPVSWDVADTNLPPINCANVDIELLTFASGYNTYSAYLLGTTLNDGNASVTVMPATANHPRARIRIKCSNSIFYDISDVNLRVDASTMPADTPLGHDANVIRNYENVAITSFTPPVCGPIVDCSPPPPRTGSDSSAVDLYWVLMMTGLVALIKLYRRYGLQ